ncbi:MAG: hypothetical protein LW823_02260 [Rickettsiales bacterium]|jgi:hypothetical protein|nr:hypothetical protein [Rickettsiales bacterium]
MTFKTHLIAISVIILSVFIAWQAFQKPDRPKQAPPKTETSAYQIIIVRASLGLNCLDRYPNAENLFENNVKEIVSSLCAGKLDCKVPTNEKTLKITTSSDCSDKELEIEYRCFSFDRLRTEKASFGSVELRCSNLEPATRP